MFRGPSGDSSARLLAPQTQRGLGRAVVPGDVIEVMIEGLEPLRITIGNKRADFA